MGSENTQFIKGMTDLITAMQTNNKILSTINQTLTTVFPQGSEITASAGAASGKYLTVTATDGTQYKIELLDVS